jgi:hypothetical protein
MSKELASSSCPVYTVNAQGAKARFMPNNARGDHSLKLLSDISGGKYFDDVAHSGIISEEIQNATGNYYVLGYYIDEKWDGKYHEIEVKVKRKGCKVYTQLGYFNPKPFTEYTEFEKQLHLIDLGLAEKPQFQDPINFPLITLHCSNKKKSNFIMLSEIPVEKIEEIVKGKAEIVTLIIDEQNSIVELKKREEYFPRFSEKKIYCYSISSLSPGTYNCRLVLRDSKTGQGAVASSSVTIPESIGSGIKLYSPLLLIPYKKAYYVKFSKTQKVDSGREPLSLIKIYPFDSGKYAPLVGGIDQGISKLLAVVRCSIVNIQKPEVELLASLIQSSTEQNIPLSFSIISAQKEEKETDILILEFQLPELQPDEYSLNLIAEELKTKTRSHLNTTFTVK